MPIKKIVDKLIDIASLRIWFLRKDAADSTSFKLTVNGLDACGQRITTVGDGTLDTDACTFGQMKNFSSSGDSRGCLYGYVALNATVPKFYDDRNADGTTEENAAAQTNKLYIVLVDCTLGSLAAKANDVVLYNGSAYVRDNSLGTFDQASAGADPGGSLQGCQYLLECSAMAGHELPNYPSGEGTFTDGTFLKWSPTYGTTNTGRWVIWGSTGNMPLATKNVPGKAQVGDGFAVNSGVLSADIDTTRGVSFSGTSPNKKFGLNILSTIFEFVGGALSVKSGVFAAATHTHAIADVTNLQTALDGKALTTRGLVNEKLTLSSDLKSAGQSMTFVLAQKPAINDATNTRKAVAVFINGVMVLSPLAADAHYTIGGTDNKTLTLFFDGMGIELLSGNDYLTVLYVSD